MTNVTFSSPVMARDMTVYAIAGDRGTILAVAKAHNVPIPFDCQDGECGSCLVEVTHLSTDEPKYGIALTEKEKEMLRQLGKITAEEIYNAETNDMPPRYRLACQCFIRDEDILVTFEGDQVLPAKKPHLTPAAKIFKGGSLEVHSLDEFLSYAVKAEEDAAIHYEELTGVDGEMSATTRWRSCLRSSRASPACISPRRQSRAGSIDVSKHLPPDYVWADSATPERADIWAGDPDLSRLDALRVALRGEKRAFEFYYQVSGTAKDPEIRAVAKEFVEEESEHVRILEAWITREEWERKYPLEASEASGAA